MESGIGARKKKKKSRNNGYEAFIKWGPRYSFSIRRLAWNAASNFNYVRVLGCEHWKMIVSGARAHVQIPYIWQVEHENKKIS